MNMSREICTIVGARPNYMKIAPIIRALEGEAIPHYLIHTGQHYDENMSKVFFDELNMPQPDVFLGIGSDTHARQTARLLTSLEEVFNSRRPQAIVVAGDVNSTLAAALVGAKIGIPIAHVEAGLRSFDREMPEEVNRVLTDHLSDLLFTTEASGNENLRNEGIAEDKIHFVGNCMVDTLKSHLDAAVARRPWDAYCVAPQGYCLLTLHRPSNVDSSETLAGILVGINALADQIPILFPIHPRTRSRLEASSIALNPSIRTCPPLPYLEFLGLMARARAVITDSGGIQEETTALGVICLTLRHNTERPITLTQGTNRLVGTAPASLDELFSAAMRTPAVFDNIPPLWDGHAAERIAAVLLRWRESAVPLLTTG